jgi:hypothetical protein
MFEILKALRDLNEACMAHGTSLRWEIERIDTTGPAVLKAEILLTDDDVQFTNDLQALFAPVDE